MLLLFAGINVALLSHPIRAKTNNVSLAIYQDLSTKKIIAIILVRNSYIICPLPQSMFCLFLMPVYQLKIAHKSRNIVGKDILSLVNVHN